MAGHDHKLPPLNLPPSPRPRDVAGKRQSSLSSKGISSKIGNEEPDMASPFARIAQATLRRSKSCSEYSMLEGSLKAPIAEQELLFKFNEVLSTHLGHILQVIRRDNERNFIKVEASIRDLERGICTKPHVVDGASPKTVECRSDALAQALQLNPAGYTRFGSNDSRMQRHIAASPDMTVDKASLQECESSSSDSTANQLAQTQRSSNGGAEPSIPPRKLAKTSPLHDSRSSADSSQAPCDKGAGDSELPGSVRPKQGLGMETGPSKELTKKSKIRTKWPSPAHSSVPESSKLSMMDEIIFNHRNSGRVLRRSRSQSTCSAASTSSPGRFQPRLSLTSGTSRKSPPKLLQKKFPAGLGEIEKFQTDMIMRTCGMLDDRSLTSHEAKESVSSLNSSGRLPESSHIASGDADHAHSASGVNNSGILMESACSLLQKPVPNCGILDGTSEETSSAIRLESSPSFLQSSSFLQMPVSSVNSKRTLESLRQMNDSTLALSGLIVSHRGSDAGSSMFNEGTLISTEPSLTEEKSDESAWSEVSSGKRSLQRLPWMIFRLFGVIPWRQGSVLSTCYSLISLLLATAVAVYPAIRIAQGKVDRTQMCILPFTVGGVLGALSLRSKFTMQLFTQFPGPLELYAMNHGFASEFFRGSLRHFTLMLVLWVGVAILRGFGELTTLDGFSCSTETDYWVFLCFLIGSMLFVALLYCQLHVICILGMMVDNYCTKLFLCPTSCQHVLDWNLIQAMLRQIAGTFDLCFMMTQTGACVAILLASLQIVVADGSDVEGRCDGRCLIPSILPPVLLALGAVVVLFEAASLSEKCSRVAPLVNSMPFDDQDGLDSKRQLIVHFISSSGAGFYIQEVRITASMAMKLMYVTGLCAFALVTKLATDTGGT